jgi:hypothetical protein
MGINLDSNYAHCFKCGEKTEPLQILMVAERFTERREAYQYLSIQQEYEHYEAYVGEAKVYRKVELPEGSKLISLGDGPIGKAARRYVKKRGFDVDDLALKGVSYGTTGEYFGYIIFPYYIKGELVYYQGRLFMGDGPKMKNPLDTQFGIGKSQVVYNLDAFYIYNTAYLVESITNALTLGDIAGGINGKTISPQQMSSIIMAPCQRVVVILDPDAIEEAISLCLQLVNYKKTKLVKLPEGVDVNDIGRKKTMRFVRQAEWNNYMGFYRMKLNLNDTSSEHTHHRRGPYQNFGRG